MNVSSWRNNRRWNNSAGKQLPQARSADNKQIVDAVAPDVTSLVFPAIGAILMVVFGGFLLSSSTTCCSSSSFSKRNNKNEDYERIDFNFMSDNIVIPRLSPVLQQEDNDIVEAVMAAYTDLPQYAPANDLLAAIATGKYDRNFIKPETRDICLSPMHKTYDTKIPVNITNGKRHSTSLEDGMFVQGSFSDLRINSEQTMSSGFGSYSMSEGCLICSSRDNQRFSDQNENHVLQSESPDLGSRHTLNNIKQQAPSWDAQWDLNSSCDSVRPAGQRNCDQHQVSVSRDSYISSYTHGSSEDDGKVSPLTEMNIQKWIGQALPAHNHSKQPATELSEKDKLKVLKRLKPRIDDERIDNKTMKEVRDDRRAGNNSENNADGVILSRLELVRASSALRIHGNQCYTHGGTGHMTFNSEEVYNPCLNDSGREASCFAESLRLSTSALRGASTFGEPTRGASILGDPGVEPSVSKTFKSGGNILLDLNHLKEIRGASSFGEVELYGANKGVLEDVIRTYGEVTNCCLTGVSGSNDLYGASGLGLSCDRLSLTNSLSLNVALQSEKEEIMNNNDTNSQRDDIAKQPKKLTVEEKTKMNRVVQNAECKMTGNRQGKDNECHKNGDEESCPVEGCMKQNTTKPNMEKKGVFLNSSVEVKNTHQKESNIAPIVVPQSYVQDPVEKDGVEVFQPRDGFEEDGPNHCSTPKDVSKDPLNASRGQATPSQMSLGKDSIMLSGLLKALQREQLKKAIKDKQETVSFHSPHKQQKVIDKKGKVEERRPFVGKIKVCLFYTRSSTTQPMLYATILKVYSLRHEYVGQKEEFLVEMQVSTRDNSTRKTKSAKEHKNSIVFNHLFQVSSIKTRELEVSVLKLLLVSDRSRECVGIAKVPLADLVSHDKIKKTYLLRRASSASNDVPPTGLAPRPIPAGAIYLGMKYNSVEEKLLIHVIKARGLYIMSGTGETDPYVLVTVKDDGKTLEERMTETKWKQYNPIFDVKYVLGLSNSRVQTCSLILRVMNNAANHSLIGTVNIGMDSVVESGRCHWESITTKPGVLEEKWHQLFKETHYGNTSREN